MLKGGKSFSLNVPILQGANNVTLINSAKHHFDLVPDSILRVVHQEVDPASGRLTMLSRYHGELA
jgi:hypothetical protein